MTNKEFIFSVKKSIQDSLTISLDELSKKTKIKTQRLKSIIYQNDNIYINDNGKCTSCTSSFGNDCKECNKNGELFSRYKNAKFLIFDFIFHHFLD